MREAGDDRIDLLGDDLGVGSPMCSALQQALRRRPIEVRDSDTEAAPQETPGEVLTEISKAHKTVLHMSASCPDSALIRLDHPQTNFKQMNRTLRPQSFCVSHMPPRFRNL